MNTDIQSSSEMKRKRYQTAFYWKGIAIFRMLIICSWCTCHLEAIHPIYPSAFQEFYLSQLSVRDVQYLFFMILHSLSKRSFHHLINGNQHAHDFLCNSLFVPSHMNFVSKTSPCSWPINQKCICSNKNNSSYHSLGAIETPIHLLKKQKSFQKQQTTFILTNDIVLLM
jgi:hypothetical protein